jgi:hypothetical protein
MLDRDTVVPDDGRRELKEDQEEVVDGVDSDLELDPEDGVKKTVWEIPLEIDDDLADRLCERALMEISKDKPALINYIAGKILTEKFQRETESSERPHNDL